MPEEVSKSLLTKIVTLADIEQKLAQYKGKRLVLAGGCYDILHFGHLEFLQKAREAGDALVIALESDEFITRHKKREPFHNQAQRSQILASIEYVDLVIALPYMQDHQDYFNLVRTVQPTVIAVTEGDAKYQYKKQQADAIGAEIRVVCALEQQFSSSKILQYANILRD